MVVYWESRIPFRVKLILYDDRYNITSIKLAKSKLQLLYWLSVYIASFI